MDEAEDRKHVIFFGLDCGGSTLDEDDSGVGQSAVVNAAVPTIESAPEQPASVIAANQNDEPHEESAAGVFDIGRALRTAPAQGQSVDEDAAVVAGLPAYEPPPVPAVADEEVTAVDDDQFYPTPAIPDLATAYTDEFTVAPPTVAPPDVVETSTSGQPQPTVEASRPTVRVAKNDRLPAGLNVTTG
ncbi:hypothetical protein V5799_020061 [Amblyomma americanum]|uniref:Uncharacterized protein n=1 Tax=Amblyomma americanum TaxID=6943 RepID=A0AAQ4EUY8_AMBAM